MSTVKFLWNGMKVDGHLYCARYSGGDLVGYPRGTITIYARDYYPGLPKIDGLDIKNDSDPYTDYCVQDWARVRPDNPHYAAVAAAYAKQTAHNEALWAKYIARVEGGL